ncbi:MAG: hypothetical protein K2N18_00435, partial [Clostridia bacterium]|nr:hypothetical protein [Clostridia bacterium]
TMYPDWSTLRYYTGSDFRTLAKDQNIFAGGTIYAKVKAFVYGDEDTDRTKPYGAAVLGYDEDGKPIYDGQDITLVLSVEKQIITAASYFYDETLGDIYALSEAQQQQLIKDGTVFDKSKYTGTVYAQSHRVVNGETVTPYGIDPIHWANNPDDYFKTAEKWGNPFEGVAVLVTLRSGTWTGDRYFIPEGATEPEKTADGTSYITNPKGDYKYDTATKKFVKLTDSEIGAPYIAYISEWVFEDDKLPTFTSAGYEKAISAKIGNQTVRIMVRVPSYELGDAVTDSWTGTPSVQYASGKAGATGDDMLTFSYDVRGAWALPTSGVFNSAQASNITADIAWCDDSIPMRGGNDIKIDGSDRYYVEREYYFFDGLAIRYPQTGAFTARIYLD